MGAYQFPQTDDVRQTVVRRFGGVDFRTHETKGSLAHSPEMQNLICAQNDFLVKRTGWKTQATLTGKIYGLFALPGDGGLCIHAGTGLHARLPDGTLLPLCSGMQEAYSQAFTMNGVLYLLDGATYRAVRRTTDAEAPAWEAVPVRDIAFVPTTTISASPTGGGDSDEPVNLLTPRRINTFIGNGSSTQFQLDATNIDSDIAVTAAVDGTAVTVSSVNRTSGLVTLAKAPANGNGLANVAITFGKTIPGHTNTIDRCRVAGLYGGKNDTRAFLAGNPDAPHTDYMSGLFDPTYFPDTGYTQMGTDASAILGYVKQYDSLLVLKAEAAGEAASYLRTYLMADDGTALYPLRQGVQGIGALAPRATAILNDLPLFLSREGVMGIYGTAVAEQRTVSCVSHALSPRLEAEPDLENACAAVHRGKYYLSVNGHVYIADGTLADEDGAPAWFYWTNVPATALLSCGDRLWFGTADGRLCRFAAPEDEHAYSDDDAPIDAFWRTPLLPLGQWGRVKNVREVIPTLVSYPRSGACVTYENENGRVAEFTQNLDLFTFDELDFSRFSFRCTSGAVSFRTRLRQHKNALFAVRIGNDRADEPFGLLALTVRWTMGRAIL